MFRTWASWIQLLYEQQVWSVFCCSNPRIPSDGVTRSHWYSGMCAPSSPPPSCAPMLLMYAEILELSVSCAWVAWIVWLELDTNCRRISLIVPSCIEAIYVANSVLSEISFLQSIVLQLRMCGRSSVFVYFSKIAKCTTIIRKCAWGWLYNNKISCFGA
jgi:hypothetical protein